MSRAIVEREITQGFVPIGTPKAYQYDAALVESAKAEVIQGIAELINKTSEEKVALDEYTLTKQTQLDDYAEDVVKPYSVAAANSAQQAKNAETELVNYLATKEEVTAPLVDSGLTISGAAADALVTGNRTKTSVLGLRNTSLRFNPYIPTSYVENHNGGTANLSAETITVPVGSTGYQTNIMHKFEPKQWTYYANAGEECAFFVELNCQNYTLNPNSEVNVILSNGTNIANARDSITLSNGNILVFGTFTTPSADANFWIRVYFANQAILASQVVITVKDLFVVPISIGKTLFRDALIKLYNGVILTPYNAVGGENLNGGVKDNDARTITIPIGYTGLYTYLNFQYKKFFLENYTEQDVDIPFFMELKAENYPLKYLTEVRFSSANGSSLTRQISATQLDNGNTLVYGTGRMTDDSPWFNITFQVGNASISASQMKVTIVRVGLLLGKFNDALINAVQGQEHNETVLTVGTGKTYTSLKSAINACEGASQFNRYKIELYDDYDVINDLTEEDLSASGTTRGLMISDYIRLVGMGYRKLITLTLPNTVPEARRNVISTLNLYGCGEIENLTVFGSNCRYAIHDDFGVPNPEWSEKHIKNCHIISDNTTYHRAYGAGYRSGMKWVFEDCIFENRNDGTFRAFTAHNQNNFTKQSELIFKNCQFLGSNGVGFGSLNDSYQTQTIIPSPVVSRACFYGCKIGGTNADKVSLYNEAGVGCQVSVTGCGNSFDNNNVNITSGDSVDYSDRLTLW